MARVEENRPLVSSVLDRLLDDQPDATEETPQSQNQVLAELRQSIRRDLENLLNTRMRCETRPADLRELERSVVAYGIPDISAAQLQSEALRRRYLREIEDAIRRFEPRFKSVRVLPVENSDYLDRTLRFRIDAEMYAFPAPEPIVFDSSMEPTTGEFTILRQGG